MQMKKQMSRHANFRCADVFLSEPEFTELVN